MWNPKCGIQFFSVNLLRKVNMFQITQNKFRHVKIWLSISQQQLVQIKKSNVENVKYFCKQIHQSLNPTFDIYFTTKIWNDTDNLNWFVKTFLPDVRRYQSSFFEGTKIWETNLVFIIQKLFLCTGECIFQICAKFVWRNDHSIFEWNHR